MPSDCIFNIRFPLLCTRSFPPSRPQAERSSPADRAAEFGNRGERRISWGSSGWVGTVPVRWCPGTKPGSRRGLPRTVRQDVAKGIKCSRDLCLAARTPTTERDFYPPGKHTWQTQGGSQADPRDAEVQGAPSRSSSATGLAGGAPAAAGPLQPPPPFR